VMQARTHRDVGYFDSSVAQLQRYFSCLLQPKQRRRLPRARLRSVKPLRKESRS
jgi:hypothetical protein